MNPIALAFLIVSAISLLVMPRRWAPLPFITGACYMTLAQGFNLGPLSFTIVRILVLVGAIRVIVRGERLAGGFNRLDGVMVIWGVWACASDAFHNDPETGMVFRFGLVYNGWGVYFLMRVFVSSMEDLVAVCRATAFILTPVAATMLFEHVANYNVFSILGGVPEAPMLREGKLRAFGPFMHPILAGTVGAVNLPLMFAIWRQHRMTAMIGAAACVTIVICSSSSGPLMSVMSAIGGLLMWRYRFHMRTFRWAAVGVYVMLDIVMKVPAYYLIARIDLTGGSTGWHRAYLIESSINHLSEWWLYGTDLTRHWMPTGVSWNPNHTDITNHYLYMGVLGGLPLMFLLILLVGLAFAAVGIAQRVPGLPHSHRYMIWAVGAALFAHATTCISVSYFDQSVVFLYVAFAILGSAGSVAVPQTAAGLERGDVAGALPEVAIAAEKAVSGRLCRPAPATTGQLAPRWRTGTARIAR